MEIQKVIRFHQLILFCMLISHISIAISQHTDDDQALIQEIANLKEAYGYIQSTSKLLSPQETAPGIVSVITEEEILNSGARDLIDILRLVPGLDFGTDIINTVGLSMRSNWVYEGGLLLLIDGIEMNERRYGTTQFGFHYPIDHLKKIEIVRGPGSVLYGGFAKLGVINLITKNAKDYSGASIIGRYGQMQRGQGHKQFSLYAAQKENEYFDWNISGQMANAHRSDRIYTDSNFQSLDMADHNISNNLFVNLGVNYQNLSMRFLFDDHKVENNDGVSTISDKLVKNFRTYDFNLKYQRQLTDDLQINAKFDYSNQVPWSTKDYINNHLNYTDALLTQRYLSAINFNYNLNAYLKWIAGIEYSYEYFRNLAGSYDFSHEIGFDKHFPVYHNLTLYLENILFTEWGQLTLGLRYDKHNIFTANLAPRIALTNKIGNFHYKILYSNSFRTPTIENYLASDNYLLKPSRTNSYEIELGYEFSPFLSLTTNGFYLSSKNTILYGADDFYNEHYYNAKKAINTVGVETELRYRQPWGYIHFNHSFAQMLSNVSDNQPINLLTGQLADANATLAFPKHKFTLNAHYQLLPNLSINPSVILTSSRYGYDYLQADGNLHLQRYSPEILANIYLRSQNFLIQGLELGVGIYDLLSASHVFIQPYRGGHAPLPGNSREFIVKLSYQL